MIASLRVLVRLSFPSETVRLWEGSGPYIDANGDVWRCCVLAAGAIDVIEMALNAEAWEMQLGLSGIDRDTGNLAWSEYQDGDVIGSKVEVLIQSCDEWDQPDGDPEVKFTGYIDDIDFDDVAGDGGVLSAVTVSVRNRFVLRKNVNGAVLSDPDQRARAAIINPSAPPDRYAERTPGLLEKTVRWPSWG